MGMILGYGLCSMFGLFYSAAHTVIPFLLLGIGIDNIFVITQTFNTLGNNSSKIIMHSKRKCFSSSEQSSTPATLAVRFGQTMKHAGQYLKNSACQYRIQGHKIGTQTIDHHIFLRIA